MPLLEGGPLHVDVGFVRQVDLTGPFEDSARLLQTLRLQVLVVLNDTYENVLHTGTHLDFYIHTQQ